MLAVDTLSGESPEGSELRFNSEEFFPAKEEYAKYNRAFDETPYLRRFGASVERPVLSYRRVMKFELKHVLHFTLLVHLALNPLHPTDISCTFPLSSCCTFASALRLCDICYVVRRQGFI